MDLINFITANLTQVKAAAIAAGMVSFDLTPVQPANARTKSDQTLLNAFLGSGYTTEINDGHDLTAQELLKTMFDNAPVAPPFGVRVCSICVHWNNSLSFVVLCSYNHLQG